jgi:starvation-inducible DNA-binding protein
MAQPRVVEQDNTRTAVIQGLTNFVSSTMVLQGKTLASHWNVQGSNFIGLHKMFEEQYKEIQIAMDELAERLRSLQATAPFSLAQMIKDSSIKEFTAPITSNTELVKALAADHRKISAEAKELADSADEAGDIATNDMLVARIEAHDKYAWMLEATLGS